MTTQSQPNAFLAAFSNPDQAAQYADRSPRYVPGFADLHRMTGILLAERAPQDAHILVHGAGGGLEIRAMAQAQPHWRFLGVDPAAAMVREARRTLGPLEARVEFCQGTIDDVPDGQRFDGATSLLTLHFFDAVERRRQAEEIRRRLKPGAPFVAAHSSFPQQPEERERWLSRYAAFAIAAGADPVEADKARAGVAATLTLYDPADDLAILRDAGFIDVTPFYAAFTWRAWVAYAP